MLTHTQTMKNKTQNRLIIGIILLIQWIMMASACTAFYIFYNGRELIDLFCGFIMLFYSYHAHTMRGLYLKTMINAGKTAEWLNWLKGQNRKTRRFHGLRMAQSMKKGRSTSKSL